MKPFDDAFADKVREVIDHHEEPFDPAAWEDMKGRLARKRKSGMVAFFPLVARVAASLLILSALTWLSVMVFFPAPVSLTDNTPDAAEEPASATNDQQIIPNTDGDENNDLLISDQSDAQQQPPGAQENSSSLAGNMRGTLPDEATRPITELTDASEAVQQVTKPDEETGETAGLPTAITAISSLHQDGHHPVNPDSTNNIVHGIRPSEPIASAAKEAVATDTHDLPLANDQMAVMASPSHEREKTLTWGVAAGSMLTVAEQQLTSGIGFTGGITSEYRLSARFRIYSGVLLAYQQFEVSGMPVQRRSMQNDFSSELTDVRTYADNAYEIYAVDLPLNIQFRTPRTKNRQWYVSTGVSSLLYLQQDMSGTETAYLEAAYFDHESSSYRNKTLTTEVWVASTYEPFARFDFARLLNFSLGYAIEKGNTTTILEPFVKIPLGTISSRDLKMGMGGISLRLTF